MRILFLGAGAIGGYYASRLADAGADVSLLVRPGRAAQLERDGLVIASRGEVRRQRLPVLQSGQVDRLFDIVLLTCKAYDLGSAMEATAPAVGQGSLVLPLLNGIAHLDELDGRFGAARVLGGVAMIATMMEPDGTIRHIGPMDTLVLGDRSGTITPPVRTLAEAFAAGSVAARASAEIVQDLWEKWCMLAPGAALTCLMRGTVGEVMATEDGPALARLLLAEARAIAAAHGHAPRPPAIAHADRILTDPQSGWAASMMRDIQQGAPRVEAEHVVGDLVRRGRACGLASPMLAAAFAQLQVYNARAGRAS
ncbi:2-dehydropantoate 2-reductase [Belnapia sp. T18]|uniref:2-dehydropantoate 2-reductase n=1 Tax=Belnapia arida TaxID=2804533 RepID=A0ABS1U0F0_9PROT|nr:2-dehydropantoate 2-reductase [Belnapia arida]MBL6077590.1 2-dehydropantoate 2-reductase [Belnapia arida]